MKERVLGLMLISRLSALLAGFTTTGTMQYQVPTTAPMVRHRPELVAVCCDADTNEPTPMTTMGCH